jgi:hypothetical protein
MNLQPFKPIDASLFGPVQQQPQQMQTNDEMNQYLMNKIEEIRKRMGGNQMGALGNVMDVMKRGAV